MSIPEYIKIKNNLLPKEPGVYLMKDRKGKVIYVGKATSLATRVGSYFNRPQNGKITELIKEVRTIDYIRVKTVLEALILEARKIKELWPKYNIKEKDDRSFVYLVITKDKYPKLLLVRGHELKKAQADMRKAKNYKKIFGPFVSPNALRAALNILRKAFPWSACEPPKAKAFKACFDYHLKKCPGVCIGAISSKEYKKNIRGLILFFEGKKEQVIREFKKEMERASKDEEFETAARIRNRLHALENIQDISVLTKDIESGIRNQESGIINIFGRIEGYDISNISGTSAVGSMVVFKEGEASKKDYRLFRIKTIKGANDVGMLSEVLRRRFSNRGPKWLLPDVILIDGGVPQVNAAARVLREYNLGIPIIGLAKGPDRKKDELIFSKNNPELGRLATQYKQLFQRVRDEAHRFAISYYRKIHRGKLVRF